MRCPQCEFENMPGLTSCFRCGSVLEAGTVKVEVHPPRASTWKGPLRRAGRWLRRRSFLDGAPEADLGEIRQRQRWARETKSVIGRIVEGLVPGLSHWRQGRLREVRYYCLAWFLLLLGTLALYGTSYGNACLGGAVGLHAWLVVSGVPELDRVRGFAGRLLMIGSLTFLFWFCYTALGRAALRDIVRGYTTLEVPHQNVKNGDLLLGRRSLGGERAFVRGALVLTSLQTVAAGDGGHWGRGHQAMFGQLIGLPGETVTIRHGRFHVNESALDPARFPVPEWLRGRELSVPVPAGNCFVSSEFRVGGRPTDSMVVRACLYYPAQIEARAFMRWLPLRRRGFLKEAE